MPSLTFSMNVTENGTKEAFKLFILFIFFIYIFLSFPWKGKFVNLFVHSFFFPLKCCDCFGKSTFQSSPDHSNVHFLLENAFHYWIFYCYYLPCVIFVTNMDTQKQALGLRDQFKSCCFEFWKLSWLLKRRVHSEETGCGMVCSLT